MWGLFKNAENISESEEFGWGVGEGRGILIRFLDSFGCFKGWFKGCFKF